MNSVSLWQPGAPQAPGGHRFPREALTPAWSSARLTGSCACPCRSSSGESHAGHHVRRREAVLRAEQGCCGQRGPGTASPLSAPRAASAPPSCAGAEARSSSREAQSGLGRFRPLSPGVRRLEVVLFTH